MTDRETLFLFRWNQAEETLAEAEKMMREGFSARSTVNRIYYSLFYALLALFIRTGVDIRTSRHTGIISLFDKEFVKAGKFEKRHSAILHDIFDARQESDYRELVDISGDDVNAYLTDAKELIRAINAFLNK